jgi:hypothetical protein
VSSRLIVAEGILDGPLRPYLKDSALSDGKVGMLLRDELEVVQSSEAMYIERILDDAGFVDAAAHIRHLLRIGKLP